MPTHYPVIPAKAGIQLEVTIDALCASLDTGFSREIMRFSAYIPRTQPMRLRFISFADLFRAS